MDQDFTRGWWCRSYQHTFDLRQELLDVQDYGVLIEGEGVALRGLFIIDRDGIIRHITINDLPVGRNVDEALRVIEAFQYFDKYGAGLPCNWKSGAEAIELDEKQSEAGFRVDI